MNTTARITTELDRLLDDVRACALCAAHLPHGVRPVLQMGVGARILIVGQAPGRKVHDSGVPFNDVSGERLRAWLGVDRDTRSTMLRAWRLCPWGSVFQARGRVPIYRRVPNARRPGARACSHSCGMYS